MVRKLSVVAIVAIAVLSVSAIAIAGPTTINLSSWDPTVDNGAIVGGTQTVTITNATSEPVTDVSYFLDPAPCDCAVTSADPSDGRLASDAWTVDVLAPGETVTLILQFGESPVVAAGAPGIDDAIPKGIALAVGVLALATAIVGTIRHRFVPVTG